MLNYDAIYKENPDYFGRAFPEVLDWFARRKERGTVLDIGCGQGRNAIALAGLGYKITGIDISKVGVDQLRKKKDDLNLRNLEVHERDFFELDDFSPFSIFLLDGFFRFHEHDLERDRKMIDYLVEKSANESLFVFCFAEREDAVQVFRELTEALLPFESKALRYIHRDPVSEWEFETRYLMEILKKE